MLKIKRKIIPISKPPASPLIDFARNDLYVWGEVCKVADLAIPYWLMSSYLYYGVAGRTPISDTCFDRLGYFIKENYERLNHPHKYLIDKDGTFSGFDISIPVGKKLKKGKKYYTQMIMHAAMAWLADAMEGKWPPKEEKSARAGVLGRTNISARIIKPVGGDTTTRVASMPKPTTPMRGLAQKDSGGQLKKIKLVFRKKM